MDAAVQKKIDSLFGDSLKHLQPMNISRRSFLKSTGALALMASGCVHIPPRPKRILVNDVQSRLNPTYVEKVISVESLPQLQRSLQAAARRGAAVSLCGGRHAMGAQQFLTNGIVLDPTTLVRVLNFDADDGTIEVQAGIQWPALLKFLVRKQSEPHRMWTFAQKQTGANRFCIGGALGSNIHSRGLTMKPLISNIESFTLLDADGAVHHCSRKENRELFTLAIGGYGLFGVVYFVKLRLVPRRKMQRVVDFLNAGGVMPAFARRIEDGFLYGDFQFAVDPASGNFLRKAIFSCYRPVSFETPIAPREKLSTRDWMELVYRAHVQPGRAFEEYSKYYRTTSGNIYWSDLHQFSGYLDNFHVEVDRRMRAEHPGSEIITEIYIPRNSLARFMSDARRDFRKNSVTLI